MKPMNYFALFLTVLLYTACSNPPENPNEELKGTESTARTSQEMPLVSEPLAHQIYLEQELTMLNCQKEIYMNEFEQGNDEMLPLLEENERKIELNQVFSEFLGEEIAKGICPKKGKKGCPKPPVNPCSDGKEDCAFNCPITIPDNRFSFISTTPDIEFAIRNASGNQCGEMGQTQEIEDGLFETEFRTENCCDSFLEVTKQFEPSETGSISYTIPIACH